MQEETEVSKYFLLLFIMLLPLIDNIISTPQSQRELNVISPLTYFRGSGALLNPSNLEYTADYYLLENLAAGLIYENWKNPEIWEPRLAESWVKISDFEWRFKSRKNIFWSDGSPIRLTDIQAHFLHLQKTQTRHLSLIKTIDQINIDPIKNTLIFQSSTPISESLLHELSLAEALVLHPKNLQGDWSVSSGTYFVKEQDSTKVVLLINDFSPLKSQIQNIQIFKPSDMRTDIDVRKRPVFPIGARVEEICESFENTHVGSASIIYYFHFNPQNPLSENAEARKSFASFIRNAFRDFSYKDIMIPNSQFIPTGHAGRLKDTPKSESTHSHPADGYTIELDEYMNVLFPETLQAEAKKLGIPVNIVFAPSDKALAKVSMFIGNQRDPLGSWRFLYGEAGTLHLFFPKVAALFEAIHSAEGERRAELLLELHRVTLEEAYAVPFLAEFDAILASDRVDLSDINPFDMRLRYFEMKWKQ